MKRWIIISAVFVLAACQEEGGKEKVPANTVEKPAATAKPTTDESSPSDECARKSAAQKAALASDPLAERITFDRHPATQALKGAPADADISTNRYARAFRTRLSEELASRGVNFAGAYSLVSVGMTGWGDNWYIVDRRNGRVTLFPYHATFLDFRKESNLIVMNPKSRIEAAMREQESDCYFLNQGEFTSLRSFYFLWQDGRLELIGPTDITPPRNRFWAEYLAAE